MTLAARPVFVCGVARSGTTLLRDLLDGHPQLVVIPTESSYYLDMEPALFRLSPERHGAFLGTEWLERLIYPPPHWLLGPPRETRSPYVEFARDFGAWWQIPSQRSEARTASWPLAALALAYAQQLGRGKIPRRAQMWVEKTLTSERFLERIWRDFPHAKVLHIVRRPVSVLASLKAMQGDEWAYRKAAKMCFHYMAPSYRIAAAGSNRLPPDRYRLVRYEELAAKPEEVMSGIAEFLGIDPSPALHSPTVAGRPALNNSSFGGSRPEPDRYLDSVERALLALSVGRSARKLGYA
jgi:hypothetical protein